ncbi:hypothetical protein AB7M71_002285 [Bradyrhizobium japonicum]
MLRSPTAEPVTAPEIFTCSGWKVEPLKPMLPPARRSRSGAQDVDCRTVGEAGLGVDAAGRGELDRIAGGDVAENEIAGGLLQVDALRRRDLVELVVGRICERDLKRVRIVRGVASGGSRGGTDIAVLGDQGQVADIARNHGSARIVGNAVDGVELDVAAAGHLDAIGLRGRDRAVIGGDAAEREAVLAAEIDIRQRLGRDRDRVVDDDEVLLRQLTV